MKFLKKSIYGLFLLAGLGAVVQCKGKAEKRGQNPTTEVREVQENVVSITKNEFGTTPEGEKIDRYSLKTDSGMEVDIITYGGIITSLKVPDSNGISKDVVLGYDNLDQYIANNPYFGAIIGRYGNRIAGGKFSIDGKTYTLATNNGANHLHGGLRGFDKVVWKASEEKGDGFATLKLTYVSKDMEEGYPGNLDVTVSYTLTDSHSLKINYEATTDKPTIVNLTNHSYFNLSGDFSQTILDHVISINADHYLPVDETLIPIGELAKVDGTPFDFRNPKPIKQDIGKNNAQLTIGGGFDHCWVLNRQDAGLRLAATAHHPASGRLLEVFTTEPGIQFYTGNFLNGTLPAKNGGTYAQRSGFCLETQHYPDSPNQTKFPSVLLHPGEIYTSQTAFKFSTQ